jgi:cell division protein FtsI/penicillin-binding protein 2
MAAVAFTVGAVVGGNGGSNGKASLAERFVSSWTHADYASMYLDLDSTSRTATSASEFAQAYHAALATATATRERLAGPARERPGGIVEVPVRVYTRLFGTLSLAFELPVSSSEHGKAIAWSRSLAFPGLHTGETLVRQTTMPPRAKLVARDGSTLAEGAASEGQARVYPLGEAAGALVGSVGRPQGAQAQALEEAGVPSTANVGTRGLEQALDARLRGSPGGRLLAEPAPGSGEARVLASVAAHAPASVRTTISPAIERAAVSALGSQYGGIVVMTPSGEILAVVGIALDSVQPPGSTFKMVTVTGVLEAHVAGRSTSFPYATSTTLDGVKLTNANEESCGGTLETAFATSCNSVFAPLGVKLGAERLVQTAERFGFNHQPAIAGAAESTLPHASEIQGELALGSSAIGQGQVQASALQMALTAATIADGGRRPTPTFLPGPAPPGPAVLSASVAHTVRRLMIAVVRRGTGQSAAISGVTVAGKTGTAELKSQCPKSATQSEEAKQSEQRAAEEAGTTANNANCAVNTTEPSNTDAWFAAFAPALSPRVVVAVLLVKDGAGGTTAAPVAREVLEAALRADAHG